MDTSFTRHGAAERGPGFEAGETWAKDVGAGFG